LQPGELFWLIFWPTADLTHAKKSWKQSPASWENLVGANGRKKHWPATSKHYGAAGFALQQKRLILVEKHPNWSEEQIDREMRRRVYRPPNEFLASQGTINND
jgi:hypothetical protein